MTMDDLKLTPEQRNAILEKRGLLTECLERLEDLEEMCRETMRKFREETASALKAVNSEDMEGAGDAIESLGYVLDEMDDRMESVAVRMITIKGAMRDIRTAGD
jgi:hypothetical protein